MTIRIPKRFRILDHKIIVRKIYDLSTITGNSAQNCPSEQWITVDSNVTIQWQRTAFMHEIIEYALRKFGCLIERTSEEHQYLVTHRELDLLAGAIIEALETSEF